MKKWIHSIAILAIGSMAAQAALIGEWNFDSQTLDDTVMGAAHRGIHRTGTTSSTTPAFTNDTPSGAGYALDLTTDTTHLLILTGNDGSGYFEPSNMTYAAWVKADGWNAADGQWESFIAKQSTTGFRMSRVATNAYTGVDFLGAGGGNARDVAAGAIDVADNQWHHVAFTYDGTTLKYYIDGVEERSAVVTYNPATTAHLTIGAWNTAGLRSINGLMDDVQIYDTALSAAEIAAMVTPPEPAGEVLFFDDFDAANGTSLYDPAGRASGTLSNLVKYGWVFDTDDVVVDGALNWDADGDKDANNEQLVANGQQLFRFASSTNSGFFNWAPYVADKVWELEYDILTGNSQTLNVGLSDITRNGTLKTYDDANYDFGFGNFGVSCRYDTDNDAGADLNHIVGIFPSRATVYSIRIRFNEPLGKATMYVNGAEVAVTDSLDFENPNRYISFGESTKYAGYIDNLKISLPYVAPSPVEPFTVIPALNLIANGNGFQLTNAVAGPTANQYNVAGTFGDFSAYWGSSAEVLSWTPYYADPDGLTAHIGTPGVDDSGVLNGTFYLDTLMHGPEDAIVLNSSMNYRNGMMQEDILSGVTVKAGVNYQLKIDVSQTAGTDQSLATFTAALTMGAGSTNPATAVSGSLISIAADSVPTINGALYQTATISGADLLAAQTSGPVNMIFEQVNAKAITDYPVSPNPTDTTQVSQVKVAEISLTVASPAHDLNKDGILDADDLTLANLYLAGDGGETATNRQDILTGEGFTPAQALAYLNLTDFDIDGDNDFDADDIVALEGLLVSYGSWAANALLTAGVNDGLLDDAEAGGGDGFNNLLEYALGGDPLAYDAAALQPALMAMNEDGTNWFYYIQSRRTDDPSLSYAVLLNNNLIYGSPVTNASFGQSAEVGGFTTFTNRTDVDNAEFFQLKVQKD